MYEESGGGPGTYNVDLNLGVFLNCTLGNSETLYVKLPPPSSYIYWEIELFSPRTTTRNYYAAKIICDVPIKVWNATSEAYEDAANGVYPQVGNRKCIVESDGTCWYYIVTDLS